MHAFAAVAAVLALPTAPSEPIHVVVLGLESAEIDPATVKLIDGLVADAASKAPGLQVLTKGDIERLVDFEADKSLLGCEADTCLAEVANALGAGYVVFGRVGRLDDLVLVQLNLFDATQAKPVGRQDVRASNLRELDGKVQPAVHRLLAPLTGVAVAPEATPLSPLVIGGVVGGGAFLLGAAVLGGLGAAQVPVVEDTSKAARDRNDAKALGAGLIIAGGACAALAAVGGAVAALGLVME